MGGETVQLSVRKVDGQKLDAPRMRILHSPPMPELSRQVPTAGELQARYGAFMLPAEVAAVLRMKSTEAFQAAVARGRLPLRPIRPLGGRKTMYATVDVEKLIASWLLRHESRTD